MKTLTLLFAAGLGFIANTHAAEAPRPLLQLSAKKQVLDSDRDKFEENLEEWKVTCSQGDVEIGSTLSSDDYVVVVKEAVTDGQGDRAPKRLFPKR
jgi:hypothetical protein